MPETTEPDIAAQNEQLIEVCERLQARVEELEGANAALLSQLSAALSANSTPVLDYGQGTGQVTLNARSIGSMFLTQEYDALTVPARPTGKWKVMADTHSLTKFLSEPEALTAYIKARSMWISALEPPKF